MTFDNEQIQTLIAEIDATLEKPSNLLGRLSGEGARHRTTLKHLRDYLQHLRNGLEKENEAGEASLFGESTLSVFEAAGGGGLDSETQGHEFQDYESQVSVIDGEAVYDELSLEIGNAMATENVGTAGLTSEASIALIRRLGHELEQLKTGLMTPLRTEVNQLQHQRQILAQEVQQLQQRHSDAQSEQALQQSLQTLMARLQEHLVAQVTVQVEEALRGIQADSANWVADQMEAQAATHQSAMQWQAQHATAAPLSIGGESPMAQASSPNSPIHQLPSHSDRSGHGQGGSYDLTPPQVHKIDQSDDSSLVALEGPELTLDSLGGDSFTAVSDESTSSAGIARRRILAAQSSEFQAQQALERDSRRQARQPAHSLEDFYVSVGASTAAQAAQAAQQRALALQHRAQQSQPGVVKGHYQNLEDALFDGIPEGDNPWAQSVNQSAAPTAPPTAEQTLRSPRLPSLPGHPQPIETAYPPAKHQIQRLTDLVDQRFDDFGTAADPAQAIPETLAAFYSNRPTSLRRPSEKKKPFHRSELRRSA